MDIQNMMQFQMQQYYSAISLEKESSAKVRNWAITIWGSYIALMGSGKLQFTQKSAVYILLIINLIFWFLDAIHHSVMNIVQLKAKELEKSMADDLLQNKIPYDYFYVAGYPRYTFRKKIAQLLFAMFLKETVLFFHLSLVIASVFVILFLPIPIS